MAQLTLRPNAVGTYQQWSLTNTTHYGATSDQNDATYVYVITSNVLKETENLADTPQAGTINFVTAYIRVKATGSDTPERIHILWRTYDTDYESAYIAVTRDSFNNYSEQRSVNPYSGQAWTWTEVNALQIGARANNLASGERFDMSEIWIVVDYVAVTVQTVTDSFGMTDVPLVNKPLLSIADSFGQTDVPLVHKPLLQTSDSFGMVEAVLVHKPLLQMADSFGMTDVPLTDKTLIVEDAFGLTDIPLIDKMLIIADSFGMLDEVFISKLKEVLDSFGMTDTILVDKLISVLDSFGMTDVPYAHKTIVVEDGFGVLDIVLSDKVLSVLDSFGMSEIVTVIGAPVGVVYKFHLPMVRVLMRPKMWASVQIGALRIALRRPYRPFVPQRPAEGVT